MLKNFFKGKNKGFYVTLATVVLSIVSAIVYATIYGTTLYMSWFAFALLIVGGIGALALCFFNLPRLGTILAFVTTCFALWLYVYNIYFFVSSCVYGIQYSGLPFSFFVNAVLYVLTLVCSIVAICLPQVKKVD